MTASRGPDEHVPPERFRDLLEAYRVMRRRGEQTAPEDRRFESWPSQIELTPYEAIVGGPKVGRLPTGRPFETRLPPGLRHGDVIWVWGWLLQVRIDEVGSWAGEDLVVREHDVWMTVRRAKSGVEPGMRLAFETPVGPFSFRVTQEAIDAGLARAPGFGLPARKGHAKGDLYIRLVLEDRKLNPTEMLKKLTKAA